MPAEPEEPDSSSIGSSPPRVPPSEPAQENGGQAALSAPGSDASDSFYEDDSDPEDPDRPNKYRGAAATWRDWTANERAVANSLDQLKAQDLAAHLYNAHQLHVRAERRQAESSSGAKEWAPKRTWTAWPLRADAVPRESEGRLDSYLGAPTLRGAQEPSSRQLLEELFIGVASKRARERFGAREAEAPAPRPSSAGPPSSGRASKAQMPTPVLSDRSTSSPTKPEHRAPPPPPLAYPLQDQEAIDRVLQRPARHALAQLDGLLAALHHSRSTYHGPLQGSDSGDDRPRSASGSRGRSRSAGSAGSRSRATALRAGQRGWDEVLGFAALAGWDRGVVARARARCEGLFGESRAFAHTLDYFEPPEPRAQGGEGGGTRRGRQGRP